MVKLDFVHAVRPKQPLYGKKRPVAEVRSATKQTLNVELSAGSGVSASGAMPLRDEPHERFDEIRTVTRATCSGH